MAINLSVLRKCIEQNTIPANSLNTTVSRMDGPQVTENRSSTGNA
jgi:hypothetical protein